MTEFDYSSNATWFITICTANRIPTFGHVADGQMHLNALGDIATTEWHASLDLRPGLDLHHMVLMPNHLHGLFTLKPEFDAHQKPQAGQRVRPPRFLGSFVAGFKSATTKRINIAQNTPRSPVWQRNYYEHLVRSETAFNRIWEYIEHNPARWSEDGENPDSPNFRSPATQ